MLRHLRLMRLLSNGAGFGCDFSATLLRLLGGTARRHRVKVAKVAEGATFETRAITAKVANVAKVAACTHATMHDDDLITLIDDFEAEARNAAGRRSATLIPFAAPLADPDPAAHCPACGSPSWWRSPSSPAWSCAYCEPRDRSRVEAHETLTLHSGRWRAGTAPPVPEPVTVAGLLELHGEIVAGCRTLDVLAEADDSDLSDLRERAVIEGFACALAADRRVRPLPDAGLPPLERLAAEIGDGLVELRRWLDQTATGRRVRAWLERTPGAGDRALLALRADPAGGLLLVLDRARTAP